MSSSGHQSRTGFFHTDQLLGQAMHNSSHFQAPQIPEKEIKKQTARSKRPQQQKQHNLFFRHSDLKAHFRVTINAVRDLTGHLKIAMTKPDQRADPVQKKDPKWHTFDHTAANPAYAQEYEISPNQEECALFVEATLYMNHQMSAATVRTGVLRTMDRSEETMIFPVRYCDLTLQSFIALEVYDMNKSPEQGLLGSTVVELFSTRKALRQGRHSLFLWKGKKAETTNIVSETPGLVPQQEEDTLGEVNELLNKVDAYNLKKLRGIHWLDRMAKAAVERRQKQLYEEANNSAFLELSFAIFNQTVVYIEEVYEQVLSGFVWPNRSLLAGRAQQHQKPDSVSSGISGIVRVYDPAVMSKSGTLKRKSPIADKYYTLTRDLPDSLARELKPSEEERKEIEEIILEPDHIQLSEGEQFKIWKYRYTLLGDPAFTETSLPKFLKSVNWLKAKEEQEALSLLRVWPEVNIQNALPLLSLDFCANNIYNKKAIPDAFSEIRQFAVKCLGKATNEEIESILLQLVQAFRYEQFGISPLRNFLIERCVEDPYLRNCFYWYLNVERQPPTDTKGSGGEIALAMASQFQKFFDQFMEKVSICDQELVQQKGHSGDWSMEGALERQALFRSKLRRLAQHLKKTAKKADRMTTALRKMIVGNGEYSLNRGDKTQMPVNPALEIGPVLPERAKVYKSAKLPLRLLFKVTPAPLHLLRQSGNQQSEGKNAFSSKHILGVLFKHGDDLRQDQLVMQMVKFMDFLLRSVNVDLRFSPYQALATTKDDGFVEFVDNSETIQDILAQHGDKIGRYLDKCAQEVGDPGARERIQQNFIRSCAGYCAVTYILGVGDRHLENLLIEREGHLFHIDFGFILGKNPPGKILPAPIRICKQMVEAMGGKDSQGYTRFEQMCVQAFLFLRQHAKFLMNLLHLMIHAGIKDLADNPGLRLRKMYEKFMPTKTRQEAQNTFKQIIKDSVSALFPIFMEKVHRWALAFR